MGIEEKLPSGILLTTVTKFVQWARTGSLWPATFGLAAVQINLVVNRQLAASLPGDGPVSWLKLWSFGRFELGPSEEEFWSTAWLELA